MSATENSDAIDLNSDLVMVDREIESRGDGVSGQPACVSAVEIEAVSEIEPLNRPVDEIDSSRCTEAASNDRLEVDMESADREQNLGVSENVDTLQVRDVVETGTLSEMEPLSCRVDEIDSSRCAEAVDRVESKGVDEGMGNADTLRVMHVEGVVETGNVSEMEPLNCHVDGIDSSRCPEPVSNELANDRVDEEMGNVDSLLVLDGEGRVGGIGVDVEKSGGVVENEKVVEEEVISVVNEDHSSGVGAGHGDEKVISMECDEASEIHCMGARVGDTDVSVPSQDPDVSPNVSVMATSEVVGNQTVEDGSEAKIVDNSGNVSVVAPSEVMENCPAEAETEDNRTVSIDGIGSEETKVKDISVEENVSSDDNGNVSSGNQDVTKDVSSKRSAKKNGKVACAKSCVSDLVWGKVRSHPWWPGLIFDPSAATKKAKKYYKKNTFLIAYFGDQTFAWNDASRIKPFNEYFSQMEKQSNSEEFHNALDCALDEVSRRVEFGLACSCLPKNLVAGIKSQVIDNPGIREESSKIKGGDRFSGVDSFEPAKLIQYIRALAEFPNSGVDHKLEHAISQAQLLAFNRSKGYSQLPEFKMLGRLLEEDEEFSLPENREKSDDIKKERVPDIKEEKQVPREKENLKSRDGSSRKRKHSTGHDIEEEKQVPCEKENLKSQDSSSRKRKHSTGHDTNPSKKEKSLSELMADRSHKSSNGDNVSGKKVGAKLISSSSSKKRKAVDSKQDDSSPDDSEFKIRKNDLSTLGGSKPKPTFRVGESILRVASQLNGTATLLKHRDESVLSDKSKGKPAKDKVAPKKESPNTAKDNVVPKKESPNTAKDNVVPKKESPNTAKNNVVLKKEYPNTAKDNVVPKNSEESPNTKFIPTEYCAPEEMLSRLWLAAKDPRKGYSFTVSVVSFFSEFRSSISMDPPDFEKLSEDAEGSQLEYMETRLSNKMVQSIPDQQASLVSVSNADTEQQSAGGTQESEAASRVDHLDNCEEEPSPTALILNFTDFASVPSITNLNRIYSQFGTLNESQTEVLKKSGRAKVIFKRRSDAETAFSSAGKYKIFGPSLVSYSLKYLPSTPSKTSNKKRSKKDAK